MMNAEMLELARDGAYARHCAEAKVEPSDALRAAFTAGLVFAGEMIQAELPAILAHAEAVHAAKSAQYRPAEEDKSVFNMWGLL